MLDLELARLGRHPEVPLRRQIAAWVASGIRDGEVADGERLPSVRRLAELVGVHRNTAWAAYRELARSGLVRGVRGSGVYAVGGDGRGRPAPVRDRRGAVASGVVGAAVCPMCRAPGRPRRPSRRPAVVVVEEGTGLRAVLVAELRRALGAVGVRVRGASAAAVLAAALEVPGVSTATGEAPARLPASALYVALPPICRRLAARPRLALSIEPLALRGGRAELRRIAHLRPGSVVGVLTVSGRVRGYARELLAGWPDLALAAPRPDDAPAVARALRVADLVWVDASFRGRPVEGGELGKGRVRLLRCLRSDSLERVALRLGDTGRGPAGVPGLRSARSEGGRTTCATRLYRPA